MYSVSIAFFCYTICALHQHNSDDLSSHGAVANRRELQDGLSSHDVIANRRELQTCAEEDITWLGKNNYPATLPSGVVVTQSGSWRGSYSSALTSCGTTTGANAIHLRDSGDTAKYDFSSPVGGQMKVRISAQNSGEDYVFTTDQGDVQIVSMVSGNGVQCLDNDGNTVKVHSGYGSHGGGVVTLDLPAGSNYLLVTQVGSAAGILIELGACIVASEGSQDTCEDYAPDHVGSEVDHSDSYIAGDVAWLVFDYPVYAYDVRCDFNERQTAVGYNENSDANSWILGTNSEDSCLKTLKREFTYSEFQNNAWEGIPNIQGGNVSFWLDFKWNEEVNNENFGVYVRSREQDMPFTLRVQRVVPIVFSLDVSWEPTYCPSSTPSRLPSDMPSRIPSRTPSGTPSRTPSSTPSRTPSGTPSSTPSRTPSSTPSRTPSGTPSSTPSSTPSGTPSSTPSRTPSALPSKLPSRTPSSLPTTSPHPPSMAPTDHFNVVWMINNAAQENTEADIPWIEIEFTTASNGAWRLTADDITGNITTLEYFTEDSSWDCVLPAGFYCQKWVAKFSTPPECNEAKRSVGFNFIADIDGYQQTYTLNTFVGGSSAFVCAQDLGAFALTAGVRYKTPRDNEGDETAWKQTPSPVYIGDDMWFRVSFASAAGLNNAVLNNFRIVESVNGNAGNQICDMCQDDVDFLLGDHTTHDRYELGFKLNENRFSPLSYMFQFDFTVEFEYGQQRRRRLSIYVDDTKETSIPITLLLENPAQAALPLPEFYPSAMLPIVVDEATDLGELDNVIPFDVRFDYDFSLVSTPESKTKFLQECSDIVSPIMCVSLRPGSIIVTFLAPTSGNRDALISHLDSNDFDLPSFGAAKKLEMESSIDEKTLSAGNSLVIVGICTMLVFAGIVAYCRFNSRKVPYVEQNEAVELA